jgi:hypothetical protein
MPDDFDVDWFERETDRGATLTRRATPLPRGVTTARFLTCLAKGRGSTLEAAAVAAREPLMRQSPHVLRAFEALTKASTTPGTTFGATWANALSTYGISQDFLPLVWGTSIFGRLQDRMRKIPFRTSVPREIGPGAIGAWVGEGAIKPISSSALDSVVLTATEAVCIVVVSDELFTFSTTNNRALTDIVAGGVGRFLDQALLDPTKAAVANVSPASITNGKTSVPSTGATAAQMQTDLNNLVAAITTSADALTWVMQPQTFARIGATLGAGSVAPGELLGLPVVMGSASPQQVALVDASHVIVASDNQIGLSVTQQALVEMDTAPTGTAASVQVSLFQQNLTGIRAALHANWIAPSGSVAYMTTAY